MNPFVLNYNPKYFCDREEEIKLLKQNTINGLNTLVHSPRRFGKSAMIHHLFHQIEAEGSFETLYIDLFSSENLEDFSRLFGENLLKKYHQRNIISGIKKLFKGLYASVSFSADGTPHLSLNIGEGQINSSLEQLFNYLENRKKPVLVAFDEFQEVATYPEKAEAALRTIIQQLSNVHFIFSGSSMHILQNMFFSAKQAFYRSSESLIIKEIDTDKYAEFIKNNFKKKGKSISDDAIKHLLEFTRTHTYYTQVICNLAFYKTTKKLNLLNAIQITDNYIETHKVDYIGISRLLSDNQLKVMKAIAKEKNVKKPTAVDFLIKHQLPSASSTLQSLNALLNKEMIYEDEYDGYRVYDVFYMRFLEKYY